MGDWLARLERSIFGWIDRRRTRSVEEWRHCAECGTHLDDSEPPVGQAERRWCSDDCHSAWVTAHY